MKKVPSWRARPIARGSRRMVKNMPKLGDAASFEPDGADTSLPELLRREFLEGAIDVGKPNYVEMPCSPPLGA
jgi:hypothetical protein